MAYFNLLLHSLISDDRENNKGPSQNFCCFKEAKRLLFCGVSFLLFVEQLVSPLLLWVSCIMGIFLISMADTARFTSFSPRWVS